MSQVSTEPEFSLALSQVVSGLLEYEASMQPQVARGPALCELCVLACMPMSGSCHSAQGGAALPSCSMI